MLNRDDRELRPTWCRMAGEMVTVTHIRSDQQPNLLWCQRGFHVWEEGSECPRQGWCGFKPPAAA